MDAQNRLNLPESGVGSIAGLGRRIAAFFIDYLSNQFRIVALEVLFGQIVLLTALTGSSFGQRLLGMQVVRLNLARVDVLRVIGRTILIFLVFPAVVWDRDTRSLHDRLLDTVVVRTR